MKKYKKFTEEVVTDLGVLTDDQVSQKYDIAAYQVITYRKEHNIKSLYEGVGGNAKGRRTTKIDWTEYKLSFLTDTNLSSREVSMRIGVCRHTVILKRQELKIKYKKYSRTI